MYFQFFMSSNFGVSSKTHFKSVSKSIVLINGDLRTDINNSELLGTFIIVTDYSGRIFFCCCQKDEENSRVLTSWNAGKFKRKRISRKTSDRHILTEVYWSSKQLQSLLIGNGAFPVEITALSSCCVKEFAFLYRFDRGSD